MVAPRVGFCVSVMATAENGCPVTRPTSHPLETHRYFGYVASSLVSIFHFLRFPDHHWYLCNGTARALGHSDSRTHGHTDTRTDKRIYICTYKFGATTRTSLVYIYEHYSADIYRSAKSIVGNSFPVIVIDFLDIAGCVSPSKCLDGQCSDFTEGISPSSPDKTYSIKELDNLYNPPDRKAKQKPGEVYSGGSQCLARERLRIFYLTAISGQLCDKSLSAFR